MLKDRARYSPEVRLKLLVPHSLAFYATLLTGHSRPQLCVRCHCSCR